MKKIFEIEEIATYMHRIEIEIDESQEEEFEEFAENVANNLVVGMYDDTDEIVRKFCKVYGTESVEFVEDGSPRVEFEAY